jgi:hypothetical protein
MLYYAPPCGSVGSFILSTAKIVSVLGTLVALTLVAAAGEVYTR